MVAPQPGHLLPHELPIRRHLRRHLVRVQHKRPPDPILLLRLLRRPQLPRQQRLARPRRPPKHPRRVGRRRHRRDLLIVFIDAHILRLVHLQQRRRRCPHDVGLRRPGQEMDQRPARPVDIAALLRPALAQHKIALDRPSQPPHRILRLWLPRRADLDDLRLLGAVNRQQVRLDLRLQLVLARLAWEHHHKAQPQLLPHRVHDRLCHPFLVAAQRDPAGALGKDHQPLARLPHITSHLILVHLRISSIRLITASHPPPPLSLIVPTPSPAPPVPC